MQVATLFLPADSPILYLQMVGRGLRPASNKSDCLVLDVFTTDDARIKRNHKLLEQKKCNRCDAAFTPTLHICPNCGHDTRQKIENDLLPQNLYGGGEPQFGGQGEGRELVEIGWSSWKLQEVRDAAKRGSAEALQVSEYQWHVCDEGFLSCSISFEESLHLVPQKSDGRFDLLCLEQKKEPKKMQIDQNFEAAFAKAEEYLFDRRSSFGKKDQKWRHEDSSQEQRKLLKNSGLDSIIPDRKGEASILIAHIIAKEKIKAFYSSPRVVSLQKQNKTAVRPRSSSTASSFF